jgi:hypothetical protein
MGTLKGFFLECLQKPWSNIYTTEMFSQMVFGPMKMIHGG